MDTQHNFSTVPQANIPRCLFNRPHNLKTTMDVNLLYPIYVDEALPADTWVFKGSFYARLSTPIVPIMDSLYLDTFFFAVPIRLVDDNFRRVMGEVTFGQQANDYVTPVLNSGVDGVAVGSLSDYLGIPPGVPNLDFVSYWHRAYNLIWNEWFRSGPLQEPVKVGGVSYDGTVDTESLSDYVLLPRCKAHDYFTSCLPTPQRGDPVGISLTGMASVVGNADVVQQLSSTLGSGTGQFNAYWSQTTSGGTVGTLHANVGDQTTGAHRNIKFTVPGSSFSVDLDNISSVTINQLRESFALQRLFEQDERSGYARIIEIIKGHFGVDSPDLRAQRPEYLGGFSQPLAVSAVPQTSATVDGSTPQGNLSAFVTVSSNASWVKSFTEHTLIIGLANLRADLTYQQGLPRMFSRRTRFDFYWPELANLGEQAVLTKEIFASGASVLDSDGNKVDDLPFGYQERWSEYKYHPNMVTGLFRSQAATSLDCWHLAQYFGARPVLNADFIKETVPIDRVLAVTDEPALILDAFYDVKCARPMPLYDVPGLGRNL